MAGNKELARLPLTLTAILLAIFVFTFFTTPEGKLNWMLEVGPGLFGIIALAIAFPRFPMSKFVYVAVFIHILILIYGGYYTYAKAPLGEWAREAFDFKRNHYDRIGHFSFGFFPIFIVSEVLQRQTPLRPGKWFTFITVSMILGFAAFYEFIEWWAALLLDPEGGDKFLGSQGDIWDAQWDMFLAGIGACVALALLGRVHQRSMQKVISSSSGATP
jgi:putative membrane protein